MLALALALALALILLLCPAISDRDRPDFPAHCVVSLQVMTLILHQHCSQEALAHFQQHAGSYLHPPPQLAPVPLAVVAAQHGWVGRQYQVMEELMSCSGPRSSSSSGTGHILYRNPDTLGGRLCCSNPQLIFPLGMSCGSMTPECMALLHFFPALG